MARTLSALKSAVNSKLAQLSMSVSDSNLTAAFNLALDSLAMKIDFKETQKTSALTPFFLDYTAYTAPSDLKSDGIIGIRPFMAKDKNEDLGMNRLQSSSFDENFFWYDAKGVFSIEYNLGTKILRVNKDVTGASNYLLHECEAYNDNGTWVADTVNSDALNVATDTGVYLQGTGAVSFDIDVSQTANDYALVYNSTLTATDLSNVKKGLSYAFLDIYMPVAVTSVELRWGTNASNYYSKTATTTFDGQSFKVGWNTVGVSWDTATETGSVTDSSIGYIAAKLNYPNTTTDQTGFRIDGFYIRQGGLYEIRYYSKYGVVSAGGTYKQYFTADDDTLACDEDGEAVFIDYVTGEIAPNALAPTGQTYQARAMGLIREYKMRSPSMRKKTVNTYG